MHAHTYIHLRWWRLFFIFAQSFVVPRRGMIEGRQTTCTRFGGDALVEGGLKRFQREDILLICVEPGSVTSYADGINNF